MPHAHDVFPWDIRHLLPRGCGHLISSFTDNFDLFHQSQGQFAVTFQGFTRHFLDKRHSLLRGVWHVLQTDAITLGHIAPLLP